ncbi:MAG: electron transport complex subunit RsxC [Bacteroidales bacterium]|nr:electron transport complex subunit RsxC [Bacteroidales bacterium]
MKTFPLGGIHPEENKLSTAATIEVFPLPKQVTVFLNQHLGAPATPIVEKGEKVKTGQLIAKAEAFVCANIHSPVSGTVNKIDSVKDMFGIYKNAIIIDVEGDEWVDTVDLTPNIVKDIKLSKSEIVDKIKEMGIVGLGGATFPTHIKYMIPEGKKAEYLIINAVECEPYLTSDHRVMLEYTEEIVIGVSILRKALGVDKAYIGIENNKPECIAAMTKMAAQYEGVIVEPLKVKYPQGAEKQLIKAITGRSVPSGKLPIDVGCVVNNVGTALAVYEAVQKNKPLIENIMTITGKALAHQHNYRIRIGISYNDIVEHIGGLPDNTAKIISGGPMMGKAIVNLEAATTKGASSMLVVTEKEATRAEEKDCIRCGKCMEACPMGLEPYLFSALINNNKIQESISEKLMDCIECGCCMFTCPANKPLLDEIRYAKNKFRQTMMQQQKK